MSIAEQTSRLVGIDMVSNVATRAARVITQSEGRKGCDPSLAKRPVDLEPTCEELPCDLAPEDAEEASICPDIPPRHIERPVIFKIWCPRDLKLNWKQYNDLHKELSVMDRPLAFEVVGNCNGVWVQVVVDARDVLPLKTAVEAEFPEVRMERMDGDDLSVWLDREDMAIDIEDYFPSPPYCRSLTIYEIIGGSPLDPIYVCLSALPKDELGTYRVLSVPVSRSNDWHARVNSSIDAEYKSTQDDFFNPTVPSYSHQLPSQYLPMISQREENKAHPDQSFSAVSVITMALSPRDSRPPTILRTLRTALSNFLYGARPLNHQDKEPYLKRLGSACALRQFLKTRTTLRPGMILNSIELSGLIHFPPGTLLADGDNVLHRIKGFEVDESLRRGRILVGHNHCMGTDVAVHIPDGTTNEHMYVIGKTGVGKSTFLENLILQEIQGGRGVGLIEPHGDLTWSVLRRIPKERINDVVFIDLQDPDYVPCLNPFDSSPHEDKGKLADELTSAFHAGLESSWGFRMENILRQSCYALLHIPGATMADMGILLAHTRDGEAFRNRVLDTLTNIDAIGFWRDRFPRYKADATDPVTNKISKLMLNTKIASMFSQERALIRWRSIMDQGKILLANLTGLGSGNTDFLGSILIALLKEATCSRTDILVKEDRRPFSLYIDEFYRFPTSSLDNLLEESRKFGVSLRLAHQETGQIDQATRRAVGTADTIISFGVDVDDAKHVVREMRKEVREEDLLDLGIGEAYAKINNRIVDLTTLPPPPISSFDATKAVIAASRRQYYVKRTLPEKAPTIRASLRPRLFETFSE